MTPRTRPARLRAEELEGRDVPAVAYALSQSGTTLLKFDTTAPATVQSTIAVTGLVAGDTLVGTDFRPATGQLYGVAANTGANTLRVYTIDLTGAATPLGGGSIALATGNTIAGATAWGVDFNPVADRIRVVNNLASDGSGGNANNLRLNPNDGTLTAIDTDLDFSALPAGSAPEVAVAYTNSQFGALPAGTATTLYGVVSGTDRLVINGTAGTPGSTLADVGALGFDTSTLAGLDVYGPNNGAASSAVAALTVGGASRLYTVNLQTGAATLVGTIGDGTTPVTDISVAPAPAPLAVGGSPDGKVQLFTASGGQLAAGASVTAFGGTTANVRSATGDVNGDGVPDLVSVTGPGTPVRVTVVSGADNSTVLVAPFDPFGGNFTGGGFVAAGDIDRDGRAEFVVTPDQGGGPRVVIFGLAAGATTPTARASFFGIDDANFRGGDRAALGDVNRDGTLDLAVTAGFLGGPRAALFDGTTLFGTPTRLVGDFFAFPGADATTLRNGAFVSLGDVTGDGYADLIFGGGPGGAPRVFILSGAAVTGTGTGTGTDAAEAAPVASFFVAGNATGRGGVRVAAGDVDGDGRADVAAASGDGTAAGVRVYLGKNFTTTGEPATFQDLAVFGGATLANGVYVG